MMDPILYLGMIGIIFVVMTIFPVYGDIDKVLLIIVLLFVLCIFFMKQHFQQLFSLRLLIIFWCFS